MNRNMSSLFVSVSWDTPFQRIRPAQRPEITSDVHEVVIWVRRRKWSYVLLFDVFLLEKCTVGSCHRTWRFNICFSNVLWYPTCCRKCNALLCGCSVDRDITRLKSLCTASTPQLFPKQLTVRMFRSSVACGRCSSVLLLWLPKPRSASKSQDLLVSLHHPSVRPSVTEF